MVQNRMSTSVIVLYALMCIAFSTASLNDIPEITPAIDNNLSFQYDDTCWTPPRIKNAKASVKLRRSGEHVFLVTYYSCRVNYKLKRAKDNALYCSNGIWLGLKPNCIKIGKGNTHSMKQKKMRCRIDNGGCAHICNRSTHKCECYEGYTLNSTDLRSCKDIDECKESNGGCSQVCNNLPGEFICTCNSGFEIDESDEKTCLDIDECADPELSWDCTAGCKNLNGTYKCLPSLVGRVEPTDGDGFSPGEIVCKSGFKLSDDGSECQDINECDLADIDSDSWRMTYRYCEHKCENTVGSYICHCPQGYHLLDDQNSCILDGSKLPPSKDAPVSQEAPRKDICPLFKGPANGKASCDKYLQNGFNYTRCNITCNAGYILQGSQFAVCGHTGLWSSPEAKCVESLALSCPVLTPPRNGRFYPASCNNGPSKSLAICELLCDRGYLPRMDTQLICAAPWGWIQRRWQDNVPQYVFQQSVKQDEGCVKIAPP